MDADLGVLVGLAHDLEHLVGVLDIPRRRLTVGQHEQLVDLGLVLFAVANLIELQRRDEAVEQVGAAIRPEARQ